MKLSRILRLESSPRDNAAGNRIVWVMLFLCGFLPAASGYAQQKFNLSVSNNISSSPEGFDFRRVEVSTSTGIAVSKDLTIWFHIDATDVWGRRVVVVEPIPITLKAGEISVAKDLYLPLGNYTGQPHVSLNASPQLRSSTMLLLPAAFVPTGQSGDVLVVGDAHSTFDGCDKVFTRNRVRGPNSNSQTSTAMGYTLANGNGIALSTAYRQVDLLPKRWIGYSSTEQVVIDSDELLDLSSDAERFEALTQWVTMGGVLVVCDCEDGFKKIPEVMRALSGNESTRISKLTFFRPGERVQSKRARGVRGARGVRFWGDHSINWQEVSVKTGEKGGLDFDTDANVLMHRFAMGQVLFYPTAYEDFTKKQRLETYSSCLDSNQKHLKNVLGTQNVAGRPFEKWQLINVGVAPTGLFIFVVVAFMTLIGPVGFSYLKVKQKLHYQIWLVPLISAAACLTLLGYAFISEGVGTKLRPTVYVELDQDRKLAATYGRYSVYSALQPPPYQFRDDQFATLEDSGDGTPAVYRWSEDGYQLSGGQSSARNVHQVFVAAPVKTDSRIDVGQTEGSDSMKLTNRLKDEVKLLVVKADGKLYFAQNLAPSESQLASPVSGSDFAKNSDVGKLFQELIPANTQQYRFASRRNNFRWNTNINALETDVGVKQITALSSVAGIKQNLEDGHYVAILDSMKEVPSVVAGAREIDGSVIVHGKW